MLDEARRVAAEIGGLLGVAVDADTVLAGRAAILNLPQPGLVSAGGATRLLPTADEWCAIALPRDDDVAALPALIEVDAVTEPWDALAAWAATHSAAEVAKRAQLLDIATAVLGEATAGAPAIRTCGAGVSPRPLDRLLVADLSSLWAGPLCGQLLARAGATVVKVESPRRPDGTRRGDPAFFDWMNARKLSYAVDFDSERLRALLGVADIVIEGSRPAALQRRKLDADSVAGRPGRIWVRINGYRDQPDRAAFGDDAAVAGGLVGGGLGGPVFFGDAIADPLSGLEAAWAIGESLHRGGGEVIDVAMAQVAARYAAFPRTEIPKAARPATTPASPLGADNAAVDRLVAERC
ncbi:CoA transferase [Candidatus Mycobacterium wuenschmannii]|uniref:CoA transferase n=1 Tax=Candidatus Mycobacterium wuenschmannii TaxID=3027808 RepID=A0ABY8VTR7_9MYCO|nr:CoA transferase [Candidatus Mycobacterium wuenschmannii]WIM87015.1 CoA transferase [Candidatus Mycobacterium wuenschmannii]